MRARVLVDIPTVPVTKDGIYVSNTGLTRLVGHSQRVRARVLVDVAFTRYCLTSKLYFGSRSSFYAPPYLQSLPYCITIARPLRNILPPTDSSFVYAIHHIRY